MARLLSVCFFISLGTRVLAASSGFLCHQNFTARAGGVNASGTHSFNPGVKTAQKSDGTFSNTAKYELPDPEWLIAVQAFGDTIYKGSVTKVYLNTNGQDYWDNTKTLFDGCGFITSQRLRNNTAYLSQNDPGDCSSTLTSKCRSDLRQRAIEAAESVLKSANEASHTITDIAELCSRMNGIIDVDYGGNADGHKLLPKECWNDFGLTASSKFSVFTPVALTASSNSSSEDIDRHYNLDDSPFGPVYLEHDCPTYDDQGKRYYYTNAANGGYYNLAMYSALPMLSIFWQSTSSGKFVVDSRAVQLSCPRPRTYYDDSIIPPAPPSGTPTSSHIPGTLTQPEIDGIIAGSVIGGVLFIALVGFCFWRHRKDKKRKDAQRMAKKYGQPTVVEDHELDDMSRPPSE